MVVLLTFGTKKIAYFFFSELQPETFYLRTEKQNQLLRSPSNIASNDFIEWIIIAENENFHVEFQLLSFDCNMCLKGLTVSFDSTL